VNIGSAFTSVYTAQLTATSFNGNVFFDFFKVFCWGSKLHLLASREYPVVDYQTMAEYVGCERLFRAAHGAFLLHMSSQGTADERIIRLTARDALSWLNQEPDQFGSYWEFAKVVPAVQQSAANALSHTV
jgi:hypothetical protein